jgi:hypothetical protein
VTICIAAPCQGDVDDHAIVACSDWLVSGQLGSAETMMKQKGLPHFFNCLTAGAHYDIVAVWDLLFHALFEQKNISEMNLERITRDVLAARKKVKIEELVQGKYALSYDDLLAMGSTKLPPESYRRTIAEIEALKLDAAFIIAGFNPYGMPLIVETNDAMRRCLGISQLSGPEAISLKPPY